MQGYGSRYAGSSSITLLPTGATREVPACPRGVTERARGWYKAFLSDPVSQLVTPAAWPKVLRLVELLSERESVEKKIRAERTVTGSMGQKVANPLLAYVRELSREIEKIEQGLGVLPQDQMRLGIAVGQAQESTVRGLRAQLDAKAAGANSAQPARRVFGGGGS